MRPNAPNRVQEWARLGDWLDRRAARIPVPDARHRPERGELLASAGASVDLVPAAHLAALAQENGPTAASADSDFARFDGVKWLDPLSKSG